MGTRHLIAVKVDNQYKVAQYGQWDGYPSGAGIEVLHFLKDLQKEEAFKDFENAVRSCRFVGDDEFERDFKGKGLDQFSRDTGSDILRLLVKNKGLLLIDRLSFAADSVFCEFAYVVDIDSGAFEVFQGFNKTELSESDRFFFLQDKCEDGYSPVKLIASFCLKNLPSDVEFLKQTETKED